MINNASTDGTESLFVEGGTFEQPDITFITLPENVGGAGGFCEGIRRAADIGRDESTDANGNDAVWIMDDDTIPEPGALEGLLKTWSCLLEDGTYPSFLASTVFGPAGEPMNVPVIDSRPTKNGYSDWYRFLGYGSVRIQQATFVSLLISGDAVRRVGLPIAEYFIWGDDTEYTRRLVRDAGPAFLCGQSRVEHRRANVKKISLFEENNPARIKLYFYYFRNALYNSRTYEGTARTIGRFLGYLTLSFTVFVRKNQRHRLQKFLTIQKGCFAFLVHRTPHS